MLTQALIISSLLMPGAAVCVPSVALACTRNKTERHCPRTTMCRNASEGRVQAEVQSCQKGDARSHKHSRVGTAATTGDSRQKMSFHIARDASMAVCRPDSKLANQRQWREVW